MGIAVRENVLELVAHVGDMGAFPVDARTVGALDETLLVLADVEWHMVADSLRRDRLQGSVAEHAAAEQAFAPGEVKLSYHLPQLCQRGRVVHQKCMIDRPFPKQGAISRQQDSAFVASLPDQILVRNVGFINGIVAEYSQPAGETAQHGVGDKTWRFRWLYHH